MNKDITSQFIDLDHGKIHFVESGTGETLLFLHGNAGVLGNRIHKLNKLKDLISNGPYKDYLSKILKKYPKIFLGLTRWFSGNC